MLKQISIIHVIVAFENDLDIIKLLDAISTQEKKCSPIVCVDNSIINSNIIFQICQSFAIKNNVKIYYLKNILNEGSSKGFALGMQKAYTLGADWIWLHDQDGYPQNNCLFSLMKYKWEEGILAPCVVGENNKRLKIFAAKIDKNDNWRTVEINSTETEIDLAGTAGLFINRNVIEKIGVYDFKHYFVGFEDFDYCMRAKKSGFSIKIINDALYFHPDKWNCEEWKINNGIRFFGSNNNNREQNGSIYLNIFYSKHLFLISLVYSFALIIFRYLLGDNINIKKTIQAYLLGILGKMKKKLKFEIDISNSVWVELK